MKAFFEKYSGLTHWLAGLWTLLIGAYASNQGGVRDLINNAAVNWYHSLPAATAKTVSALFAVGLVLVHLYYNGTSSAAADPAAQKAVPRSLNSLVAALLIPALVLGTSGLMLSTTGCSSQQVAQTINGVLAGATKIIAVADPSAPWLTPLQDAEAKLAAADATWQSGGSVQLVIDALDVLEVATAAIPLTATYSPLVDILVQGVEEVLTMLPPSTNTKAVVAKLSKPNPHAGRVVIPHHFARSRAGDFKLAWNQVATSHPALASAAIK